MEEKIVTLHPDPAKAGLNIRKEKYEVIRDAILRILRDKDEMLFKDLAGEVEKMIEGGFEGSISWYVTTVKLDLEARGVIERVHGMSPQRLRIKEQ
jgi:hypothetical protein